MIQQVKVDNVDVSIYENREQMGKISAVVAAEKMRELLRNQPHINMVFAAAPSQNEFLEYLSQEKGIDWNRINAFHMDEYIGLKDDAPQRFGNYLNEHIFNKFSFKSIHYINGNAPDIAEEARRYSKLLKDNPIDIVLMGIGENGHIAFNDPPANFNDPEPVKKVALDLACRVQQVNDKCFDTLEQVPEYALTLTIPALLSGKYLFCMVPSRLKANAVKDALTGPISEECPASVLRTHGQVKMFLDQDSASLVNIKQLEIYA